MMEKLIKKLNNRKGFTLIELIVVIAIIGILAAILIPQFSGFTNKAKKTEALVAAKSIGTAIDSLIAEGATLGTSNASEAAIESLAGISSGALSGTITDGTFTYTVNTWQAGRATAGGPVKALN